jgi:hypothetical protein
MAIHFAPRLANNGFAQFVTPKWQMVPVGGTRELILSNVGSLMPRVANSAFLTVTQRPAGHHTLLLTLTGVAAGLTSVEWFPTVTTLGPASPGFQLDVSVKDEKRVSTAFFYVDDGHVQKTRRRVADLDAMLVRVNRILTPQANVVLVKRSAAALPVAKNMGRVVRFAQHLTGPPNNVPAAEDDWADLVALRDASADFNVFFVKEYEQDMTPNHDDADAGTIASDKMTVFEDNNGNDPVAELAHEFVHGLGVAPHESNAMFLMATGAHGIGRLLTRTEMDIINPSGT